jgi:cytochrome c oxidase subunit 2
MGVAMEYVLSSIAGAASGAGRHSVLEPHGPYAGAIESLFWIFMAVAVLVFVGVAVTLAIAALRGIGAGRHVREGAAERTAARVVAAAVAATVLTIAVLTVASYVVGRTVMAAEEPAMTVAIDGRQWWWQITYEDGDPHEVVTTANELRIPVGKPVRLTLTSSDVIHSFWLPSLAGKKDLIPGRENVLFLQADRPGVYRGQCAEFCGIQHAHMGLVVHALEEADYAAWRKRENAPAAAGADHEGFKAFMRQGCALCHAIRGTPAAGRAGPDLTHFGSRSTIAAGTLPNRPGELRAWIADPQHAKPGAKMPALDVEAPDLDAIAAYLGELR